MPPVVLATLADQPFAVAAITSAWCLTGVAVAAGLARRGHSFRHVGALGFVLGPLLIGFAQANLRWKERHARPVVLRTPRPLGGTERALVAVLGDRHHIAESLAVLWSVRDRLDVVDVGVVVTFDDADEEVESGEASPEVIDLLAEAARCLDEFEPGLVLLPGRAADAVARYVESEGADIVVIAADDETQSALCNDRRLRNLTTVLGTTYSAV